jgi:decaprenylphospho-beta-D-ribofuranose 2-oxidase
MPMLASLSPARLRALVRLAGGALCLVGLCLPILTESALGVPGSGQPLYEWQVVLSLASSSVVASALAALSLLAVLLVLATSVATWFTICGPRLALANDLAATWGLAIQLSLDFLILHVLSLGNAQWEIAWGFVVPLVGFSLIFASAVRLKTTFTPLTCLLLAIGSVILGLAWVFFDFFSGLVIIDVSSWLPLFLLSAVVALFMTKEWAETALTLPLVLVALYGLYYLLLLIGAIPALPAVMKFLIAIVILIVLNGSMVWLTRRLLPAGRRATEGGDLNRRSFIGLLSRSTIALAAGGLFVKAYIWDDPSKQWLLADLFPHDDGSPKLTLAPAAATRLTDASQLNSSVVAELRSPRSVAEILTAIRDAQSTNKKISLSGVRHSMGGQALGQDTLHLDLTHMDTVRYDNSDQTVIVGPGATWRQIQTALSQHGRAVRVMQDSNIFSVGGSLSVNVHGKDPRYGSLIESVNYLKVVTMDGQELRCDRTQNQGLFAAVIGGYGLLGIITEVSLLTTANSAYAFSLTPVETQSLLDRLESMSKVPEMGLLEAHLSVDAGRFLSESLIYAYAESKSSAQPPDDLTGENSIWLRKVVFQASRASNFGKYLRWEVEKRLTPLVEAKTASRNTAMAVPVRFLQNPDPYTTDILQEYFVPTEHGNDFLERYKGLLKKHSVNLLNVTIRKVNEDTTALVSYAQRDMYGFVVYYKVAKNASATQALRAFTSELIDYLISIKATYYLCYGSYYTPSQLTTMYPELPRLFTLKAQRDPHGLLTNLWYEQYRGSKPDVPKL